MDECWVAAGLIAAGKARGVADASPVARIAPVTRANTVRVKLDRIFDSSVSVYLSSGLVVVLLLLKTSPCHCCLFLLTRVSIEGKQTEGNPDGGVFSASNLAIA